VLVKLPTAALAAPARCLNSAIPGSWNKFDYKGFRSIPASEGMRSWLITPISDSVKCRLPDLVDADGGID
jgi:hypothetical protein